MHDGNLDAHERQVARDRASLAESLEALSQTMAPERIRSDITRTAETYGRQLWNVARDNPAAFALLGAGATLLATGLGHRKPQLEAKTSGAAAPEQAMQGRDDGVTTTERTPTTPRSDNSSAAILSAGRMRAALEKGLDRLPPDARRRVLRARLSALRIQETIERRAEKAASRSAKMIRDHPVESGALAFGLGVLSAALLPSSDAEDALLGAKRDALMRDARDAMRREIEAIKDAAREDRGSAPEQDARNLRS